MVSESSAPSGEETGRRGPRTDPAKESGGGGKMVILVLVVLVAGSLFLLYRARSEAATQAENDAKTLVTLTNQLSEAKTRLALEQGTLIQVQSNLQATLQHRMAELTYFSNRFVQTGLLLSNAQQEKAALQGELPAKAVAISTLEAVRDELIRQTEALPQLEHEIADQKLKLDQARLAQASQQELLAKARHEAAELERKLMDSAFVRLQARRLDEAAELRQQEAAGRKVRATDPRSRLELQPDGSVQVTSKNAPK